MCSQALIFIVKRFVEWRALFLLACLLGYALAGDSTANEGAIAGRRGSAQPHGLVLALAQFKAGMSEPGAARLEFLVPQEGQWRVSAVEDAESNVFHKAMAYAGPTDNASLLTVSGMQAAVKLWSIDENGLQAQTLWSKDFGGKFNRMRDVEIADLFGDGHNILVVATHDQGVVALLRPNENGSFHVTEIDRRSDTFVHEIEIGDLDGDQVLEVYATPSEPNTLDGEVQSGQVVRYVPKKAEGRTVVAELVDRHAKEILVDDVDGNGTDELYVVVEGRAKPGTRDIEQGVEVRRYEAQTPPANGVVIAEVQDLLARFLTAGDIDGDGQKEMVLATFSSGLWLLRPGADPNQPWQKTLIDKHSAGFEHASILTDLDRDGVDELYVASDRHKEVRRYVWTNGQPMPEVIYKHGPSREVFTWNLMPLPISLIPASE